MNWITDKDTFKNLSKLDLMLVYARKWSNRFDNTAPRDYYIAYSDMDGDFSCVITRNTLRADAAMHILTPLSKWITSDTSTFSSLVDGKYVVWGYEYDGKSGVDKNKQRNFFICELKTNGWHTSDGRRIWAFALQKVPKLPEDIAYPVVYDEFDDIEHYFKVKLKGLPSRVNLKSGPKDVFKYEDKYYDMSQPVKLKNKTLAIAYKD